MDVVVGAKAGSSRGRSPAFVGAFSGDPNAGIQVELGFIGVELMTLAQEVHKPIRPHDDRATLDWTRRAVGAYRRRQTMPRRFHTIPRLAHRWCSVWMTTEPLLSFI